MCTMYMYLLWVAGHQQCTEVDWYWTCSWHRRYWSCTAFPDASQRAPGYLHTWTYVQGQGLNEVSECACIYACLYAKMYDCKGIIKVSSASSAQDLARGRWYPWVRRDRSVPSLPKASSYAATLHSPLPHSHCVRLWGNRGAGRCTMQTQRR